jgi:hypothetical protein
MLPNYENARRVNGMDWPMGTCANGHPNSMRTYLGTATKKGRRRKVLYCEPCKGIYQHRGVWRASHPNEPMPEHLLLASEKN